MNEKKKKKKLRKMIPRFYTKSTSITTTTSKMLQKRVARMRVTYLETRDQVSGATICLIYRRPRHSVNRAR